MTQDPALEKKKSPKRVVFSPVAQQKKTLGQKLNDIVFSEAAEGVIGYVLWDIVVPAAKALVVDSVTSAIEMAFYGEEGAPASKKKALRDRGNTFFSYDKVVQQKETRTPLTRNKPRYANIVLGSRREGEEVLQNMYDEIEEYGAVSVTDLYTFVGIPTNYTTNTLGWTNLSTASVERVREGYLLKLPDPVAL